MSSSELNVAKALSEAQSILKEAERRASEVLADTQRTKKEAEQAGYQHGYEVGRREAFRLAVRALEQTAEFSESVATEAARLAISICAEIFDAELAISPEKVRKLALRALQHSIAGTTAVLVVSPEDQEMIEQYYNELQRVCSPSQLRVETDPSMERGSCVVRTDFGEVDASIGALLDGVAKKLGVMMDYETGAEND